VPVLFALRPARRAARAASAVVKVRAKLCGLDAAVAAPALFIAVGRQLNFIEHLLNAGRALGGAGGQEISECLHLSLLLLQ
jgi:hypothetical protein